MGAFDSELYALGYRIDNSPRKETEGEKFNREFIGPRWVGECVGFCSSTRCLPCPSNNRESQEYFDNAIKWFKRDISFWKDRGNSNVNSQHII